MEEAFLMELIQSIVLGETDKVRMLLLAHPNLAHEGIRTEFFSQEIVHQLYAGDTGLHVAAAAFKLNIATILLASGAEVCAKNRRGAEALHYASDSGPTKRTWDPKAQENMITFLIKSGANPNAIDKCNASPLHRAVRTRSADAVRALLAGGALVAIKNDNGSTPLHLAVQNTGRGGSGSPESKAHQIRIIELLLKNGADPEAKDSKGKTVRQWIREESIKSLFS